MVQVNAGGAVLTAALLDFVLEQAGPKAEFFQCPPDEQTVLAASELVWDDPNGMVMHGRYVFFDANVAEGTLLVLDSAKNVLAQLTNFGAPASISLAGVTVTTV